MDIERNAQQTVTDVTEVTVTVSTQNGEEERELRTQTKQQ
jgi:hypothetical protein